MLLAAASAWASSTSGENLVLRRAPRSLGEFTGAAMRSAASRVARRTHSANSRLYQIITPTRPKPEVDHRGGASPGVKDQLLLVPQMRLAVYRRIPGLVDHRRAVEQAAIGMLSEKLSD